MIQSLELVFKANATTNSTEHSKVLRQMSIIIDRLTTCFIVMFVCLVLVLSCICFPLFTYFVLGEVQPIVPVFIPGIDEKTTAGFLITTTFHVMCAAGGSIGYGAFDAACGTLILGTVIYGLLIKADGNALNDMLQAGSVDRISVQKHFRGILMMQREMAMYEN